jgi:serine/threonine protein kinase
MFPYPMLLVVTWSAHFWRGISSCGVSVQVISKVRNEKAKRFLSNMREKPSIAFSRHFQGADPKALALLRKMLAFDPQQRPSAVEALADPYFHGAPLAYVSAP